MARSYRPRRQPEPRPDVTTASGWRAVHEAHGRGPWRDATIGEWHVWRCFCGERFTFTEAQRNAAPESYVLRSER
jgi:hypothetical protein